MAARIIEVRVGVLVVMGVCAYMYVCVCQCACVCSRPCARLRLHARVHAMSADPRCDVTENGKAFVSTKCAKKCI